MDESMPMPIMTTTSVSLSRDTKNQSQFLTNPGDGHLHEVSVVALLAGVVLQALKELQQDVLGDLNKRNKSMRSKSTLINDLLFLYLASPSLEVREPGEPEVCIQLVRGGVERPPHCGRARRRGRPAQLLQLLRVLDSVHPVTLDGVLLLLLLVDPALLVHHVLLLIRHHDRSGGDGRKGGGMSVVSVGVDATDLPVGGREGRGRNERRDRCFEKRTQVTRCQVS